MRDHRGRHMVRIKGKNIKAVAKFYKDNPDAMMKDCEVETGLSPMTVRRHVKTLGLK